MTGAVQTAAQKPTAHGHGSNSRYADAPMGECGECGLAFVKKQPTAEFCCTPCRQEFNNRRMKRGAEVYDLLMAMRFERSLAGKMKVFGLMCRAASVWKQTDNVDRPGRKSWGNLNTVVQRLNSYRATIVFKPRGKS